MASRLLTLQKEISAQATWDENECVAYLLDQSNIDQTLRHQINQTAVKLINKTRSNRSQRDKLDAFLEEFGLDNAEGTALMCLAEALLRIPDSVTADEFIQEKLQRGDWQQHLGNSDSLFVNASTWGLLLTGKWLQLESRFKGQGYGWVGTLLDKFGEPVLRMCLKQAMKIMGEQYILGRNCQHALERGSKEYPRGTLFSFDALGEGARTSVDAEQHHQAYNLLLDELSCTNSVGDEFNNQTCHGISIKLSALHPRFQWSQRQRIVTELLPRLIVLAKRARENNVALTVDAEESERLPLTMELFSRIALQPGLRDWEGLGFVLQCYQKRAITVVSWLKELARVRGAKLNVRIVKGAYWDSEIKRAQLSGLSDYPVFTRKVNTDLSYLVCVEKILTAGCNSFYPQFATHNAYTISAVTLMADSLLKGGDASGVYELQRLHGMGDLLFKQLPDVISNLPPIRIYAPLGNHQQLLPYLVRRLLENGANSSFVNRFMDENIAAEELATDVMDSVALRAEKTDGCFRHVKIPKPTDLYGDRPNSSGLDLENEVDAAHFVFRWDQKQYGFKDSTDEQIDQALSLAHSNQSRWNATGGAYRADILERAGKLIEKNKRTLMIVIVNEAGRTVMDAESEVREAVDFCYYYALQARKYFTVAENLQGPTGESNQISYHGRGVFVCISPWNFPLAIFVGQVVAALAAGNTVIAKPAEQTPAVAMKAVELLLLAGIPSYALQLLPGDGPAVGEKLITDNRISGVAFTGSTQTAKHINLRLAERPGPIIPFIAETGGINIMLVDSTALLEQVTDDVLQSAFYSAGQRCSSLRLLIVQEEIADQLLTMLAGACDELSIGDPGDLATDIGPVIDASALELLNDAIEESKRRWPLRYVYKKHRLPREGNYLGPHIFEVEKIADVEKEIFGPVLHVLRYSPSDIDKLLEEINNSGFALTLGVHSRLQGWADKIFQGTNYGNTYVNRNMVGAVVGVQSRS